MKKAASNKLERRELAGGHFNPSFQEEETCSLALKLSINRVPHRHKPVCGTTETTKIQFSLPPPNIRTH